MPRKIRSLVADLRASGWRLVRDGKGSHRKFQHANLPDSVTLSGQDGGDARRYQEELVAKAVRAAAKSFNSSSAQ